MTAAPTAPPPPSATAPPPPTGDAASTSQSSAAAALAAAHEAKLATQNSDAATTGSGPTAARPVKAAKRKLPRQPSKIEDLGIPTSLLEDLFLRRLMNARETTTSEMASYLAVSMAIVQVLADELRDRGLVQYLGRDGREYRFGLTDQGHNVALERNKISLYDGFVPVPLKDYVRVIESQQIMPTINPTSTREVFSDLVVDGDLVDRLGGGFLNEGAIFIYGPPGTGKTSLAERMGRLYSDPILIPHCIEVDGQLVMLYDPAIHHALPTQPAGMDPRWVLCKRPLVLVGGELTLEMLDLSYESVSGIYNPAMQLLANNGILVVDDFGRQTVSPEHILNRWIVPLSRGVDFLRLNNGSKFTVPFALKLVVSSNMEPKELGDDAFLRRLRNKVYVGGCTAEQFEEVLFRVADAKGIDVTDDAIDQLMDVSIRNVGELRPYIPVDFCDLMQGICAYDGRALVLNAAMVEQIAHVYFLEAAEYSHA